ncbi:PAP2 family protein [Caballeronia arvi]|uniref:PAP2 family protein n=1 Tax=Caballeronia arvi TaxID=1777135 RepID=A0A158L4A6_9BURK|nr:phosphatase PAP2 family protein [Caballeronia arvi]SAL88244.1 PAP2 family protein [Caballeronia arvi]
MKSNLRTAWQRSSFDHTTSGRTFGFTWALLTTIVLVDVVWLVYGEWQIQWQSLLNRAMFIAACFLPLVFGSCRRSRMIRALCEAYAVATAFSTAAMIFSYLVASTAHPLTDSFLAAADLSLGFHWGGYYQWFTSHPDYAHLAGILYDCTIWGQLVVMAFLALSDRRERLVELVELLASTLVVAIIVSYLAPTTGAAKYYWGQYHADISPWTQFELLRSGTLRTIDVSHMQGLISMPSMHTVIGALLCWSVRKTRVFVPLVVLNMMMLSATPVYGGHHAIDLVAGALMSVVAVTFRRRMTIVDDSASSVGPRITIDV